MSKPTLCSVLNCIESENDPLACVFLLSVVLDADFQRPISLLLWDHFIAKLPVPVVSCGRGWGSSGEGQQVHRTPPYGSGAETSPWGDMETGLTPPPCIQPWGLIKENNNNKIVLKSAAHSGNLCVISDDVCVYPDRVLCEPVQCGVSFCRLPYAANTHSHRFFPERCTLVPSAWFNEAMHTCKTICEEDGSYSVCTAGLNKHLYFMMSPKTLHPILIL